MADLDRLSRWDKGPGPVSPVEKLDSRVSGTTSGSVRATLRELDKILLVALIICSIATPGLAQLGNLTSRSSTPPITKNEPVTFSADEVDYDKDKAFVTATGHVEAWQNGHVMRADKITFDRNTGVAAATGHVVLLEPDGEVLFADYAEMQNNMNDGILKDMRALLQQNGRLAANGAQRTGGQINEMSKVVYTTCNLCAKDPTKPPLWQIRAASAVQDLEHKKIEFSDATLQMYRYSGRLLRRISGLPIPRSSANRDIAARIRELVNMSVFSMASPTTW